MAEGNPDPGVPLATLGLAGHEQRETEVSLRNLPSSAIVADRASDRGTYMQRGTEPGSPLLIQAALRRSPCRR